MNINTSNIHFQKLQNLWNELDVYQNAKGYNCTLECKGMCCHFETLGVIPFVNEIEGQFLQKYIEENSLETNELHGLHCPFLKEGKCMVHQARPTDCRVYFCNYTNQEFKDILTWLENTKKKYFGSEMHEEYRQTILDWYYETFF